jgi:hypothetical protein
MSDEVWDGLERRISKLEKGHSDLRERIEDGVRIAKSIHFSVDELLRLNKEIKLGISVASILIKLLKWVGSVAAAGITAYWYVKHFNK